MTNFEYWKDTLKDIVNGTDALAVVNGVPKRCSCVECSECDFDVEYCNSKTETLEWLLEEYIEKHKLTKKERMFCELVETGWIAKNNNNVVGWFKQKPHKKSNYWLCEKEWFYANRVFQEIDFPFIKKEDKEPWSVEDLLKLEVE